MSAKPGTLPRWADVGGSIVVPPAGTLNVGHLSNQAPLHSYENWYKNLVYQWIVYLNDGDVALHNIIASGTLNVTGTTTLANLTAATTTVSALGVTNGASIGAASTVNGTLTVTGSLTSTGASAGLNLHETAGGSTERVRLQAPASIPTNYDLTFPSAAPSGTKAYFRVNNAGVIDFDQVDITNVSAANAQLTSIGLASTATYDGTAWFLNTSGGGQGPVFNVPCRTGGQLTAIKVYGNRGNATGGVTATVSVRNMLTNAVLASGTASQVSGIAAFVITISGGSFPFTIPGDACIDVAVNNTGGAGSGNSVFGVAAFFA